MLKKLSQKKGDVKSFDLIDDISIQSISRSLYYNELIIDGKTELPSCVNCEEKYCYKFTEKDVDIKIFDSLPYNNDLRVCPVNAIVLDESNNINISDSCISCGLCVQRCPIGGLYLNEKNTYKATKYAINENVYHEINDTLITSLSIQGKIQTESYTDIVIIESHLNSFYSKIKDRNTTVPDFELIISRNILNMLGLLNKVTAKGNNDSRFDLIGILEGKYILAEIDFKNNDNLSLIRKTLENISILENKFKITKKDNIIPVIIINDLPNKRSDMYELLDDIYKVLNIKIYTLPLHFLLISLLKNKKIELKSIKEFYINKSNNDFLEPTKKVIKNINEIDQYFKLEKKYKALK